MKKRIFSNPSDQKWEFETNAGYLADAFLQILELFCISPYYSYIPSYLEYSQIYFRATESKKKRIYYVFNNYASNNLFPETVGAGWSVSELNEFKEGGDWYAIY